MELPLPFGDQSNEAFKINSINIYCKVLHEANEPLPQAWLVSRL